MNNGIVSTLRRRIAALAGVLLLIELFDEIVDGVGQAAWPLVREDLGLSYVQVGLLFAVPTVFAHVVEPIIGLLGDVWHRHAVIALGGLSYAVALLLFATAPAFESLLFAMVLLYPSSGAFVALSQGTLVDLDPEDSERSMVAWTVAGSIGIAVGPLVLLGALAADLGWRRVYITLAVTAFLLAIVFVVVAPRRGRPSPNDRRPFRAVVREAVSAATNRSVLRWLVLLAAIDLVLETMVAFLALYFVDEVGISVGMAAAALSVWTVAALAGEALLFTLIRRVDGLKLVRRSAAVVFGLMAVFLIVPSPAAKIAVLGLIAMSSAGWYSLLVARYYAEFEGRSGMAMAVSSVMGPVQALVPAAIGLLADTYGLSTAMWCLLAGPLILWIGLGTRR